MGNATSGDRVKIHYTGKLEDGTEFDSSAGRDPLEFQLGSGQVIAGFDKAVEGMAVGDKKSVTIPPEQAYGPHQERMVQDVPKSALPEELTPTQGMALQTKDQNGNTIRLTVTEVKEDTITVDANHPLAGKSLEFDIELVEIA